MEILEAIYTRRATRSFLPGAVDDETVKKLLSAAVQAPSAMNAQDWSFVVVEGTARLDRYSERAKALLRERSGQDAKHSRYAERLADRHFNIFYDASTLIVICGPSADPYVNANCWLAAQNLQLAAVALGLGTCCIGFAVPLLNDPEIKAELGIPPELVAVAPLIIGTPTGPLPPVPRRPPSILSWVR